MVGRRFLFAIGATAFAAGFGAIPSANGVESCRFGWAYEGCAAIGMATSGSAGTFGSKAIRTTTLTEALKRAENLGGWEADECVCTGKVTAPQKTQHSTIASLANPKVDALIEAAGKGDLKRVKALVKGGLSVDARDDIGVTALMEAAYAGRVKVVKYLLQAGADPNVTDEAGTTPLAEALNRENRDVALALIEAGANVNIVDNEDRTPLSRAVEFADKRLLKAILKAGANPNTLYDYSHTALLLAATQNDLKMARLLVSAGADPNLPEHLYESSKPISVAANHGNWAMVELFLDAEVKPTQSGMKAAASEGERKLLNRMVTTSGGDHTDLVVALDAAARNGHLDVVKDLVKNGADMNAVVEVIWDKYGPTIIAAVEGGNRKLVAYLIDRGADVNARDPFYEYTVTSLAAVGGKRDIVKLLKSNAADLSEALSAVAFESHYGSTFSVPDRVEAASLLIDFGAPTEIALEWAITEKNFKLVRRWLPSLKNWGSKRGGKFVVSHIYERLVEFGDGIGDCPLVADVKERFRKATGYKPPRVYLGNLILSGGSKCG